MTLWRQRPRGRPVCSARYSEKDEETATETVRRPEKLRWSSVGPLSRPSSPAVERKKIFLRAPAAYMPRAAVSLHTDRLPVLRVFQAR
ncbi:hypothetical protein BESB_044680 [Besnoitia besnoiti]|uniref:Uncharacterized protein n=1 Tax=Besnoitia besnoiti TaxID=94643 RepID=A0A2A9MJY2_BESBE|nr:hypothetical protein BESB_044680 [Besnoitia besnoiti]PFH36276.1 hypothetical protein BESB_044680 [Besnoitia besnoiti]